MTLRYDWSVFIQYEPPAGRKITVITDFICVICRNLYCAKSCRIPLCPSDIGNPQLCLI